MKAPKKMARPGEVLRRIAAGMLLAAGMAASAGEVTYYHNDLAGSPIAATNASGQVIWRESYRPYGERLVNAPASSGNKVWFTSRRQDAETGLVYMGARYYDPVVGRFMSTDAVHFQEGNVHSFNRYAYANNNPYKYVDPTGEAAEDLFPTGAPIVSFGRSLGGLAAYVQGAASNNSALMGAAAQGLSEERAGIVEALLILGTMGRAARLPEAGGGAKLENISAADAARIQNAANRTGLEVTVVGSRARGEAKPNSDWDYVLSDASRRQVHNIRNSLPEGRRGLGEARNQDISVGAVDKTQPYIRFSPGE